MSYLQPDCEMLELGPFIGEEVEAQRGEENSLIVLENGRLRMSKETLLPTTGCFHGDPKGRLLSSPSGLHRRRQLQMESTQQEY